MHIDRANQVTVSREAAGTACPSSAFGLVCMSTSGTPARCSSFGAGEARDAGLFAFVGKIVDVTAVLPYRHALVVMPARMLLADAMWIADEEAPHFLLRAEVDDSPRRLMAQIADTSLTARAHLVLGALQFFPATRVLRAMGLLPGKLPHLPVALPFERADPAPGDDQGTPSRGRHSRKVDFTQVNGRLTRSRRGGALWDFHADVQFEAAIPDQGTGPGFFGQSQGQHEGFPPVTHRQDHPSLLFRDGLGRPLDRIEVFRPPRVLHVYRGVGPAQLAGRVDRAEEGAEDCLDRLTMQGEAVLGSLVQLVLSGPRGMRLPRRLMQVTAGIPYRCRLHLGRFEPMKERRGGMQSIHTYGFHMVLFFFSTRKVGMGRKERQGTSWSGVAFIPPLERGGSSRSL
jgi:hypothetical protein